MKRFLSIASGICLFFAGANAAKAITMIARDFDQLVSRAETVFKGVVTSKRSLWTGENETRRIATRVTFRVEETYKGEQTSEQTLEFVGGAVDGETLSIPDMPQFEVGQRAVLFVVNNGRQFCPLVGIAQGRFHVVKEVATGRECVYANDYSPVVDTAEIGQVDEAGIPLLKRRARAAVPPMSAEDFKAKILGKLAGYQARGNPLTEATAQAK